MVSGPDLGIVAKLAAGRAQFCALTIAAAAVCLAFSSTATAAPAPAWSIVVTSYPTQFEDSMAGGEGKLPGYFLLVTNSGGAATSGGFTITDSLPGRLAFATAAGASGTYGGQGTKLVCSVALGKVSCSGSGPLQPGETAWVNVPVTVKPGSFSGLLNKASVSGGGAPLTEARIGTPVGGEVSSFDFLPGPSGFDGGVSSADGFPATLAGSHPYQFRTDINFPTQLFGQELLAVGGGVRDLNIALPPGLVADPNAVPVRCTESELGESGCPSAAQVGTVALVLSALNGPPSVESAGIFVMKPPPGVAVEFGLSIAEGTTMHLLGRLRNDGSYGLTADINDIVAKTPILGAEVTLWGDPSDASHDHVRGACLFSGATCPVERTDAAFLTLPGSC